MGFVLHLGSVWINFAPLVVDPFPLAELADPTVQEVEMGGMMAPPVLGARQDFGKTMVVVVAGEDILAAEAAEVARAVAGLHLRHYC